MTGNFEEQQSGTGGGALVQPLLAAALVVLVLAVLLSDRLNGLNLLQLARYWPVFLIGGAIAALLDNRDRR